ncbi:hypothetical protein ACJ72_03447 [Emergomyces africanus]|uniref:ADP-ribosylation factor-like protein 2 n=1 Tax=Emergomyces africanus TaxID=1955775 RepID=A0A1B7NZL9_9EURO|nr:hypothetical protein ACJ72_03447 [Emergomyces africanus]
MSLKSTFESTKQNKGIFQCPVADGCLAGVGEWVKSVIAQLRHDNDRGVTALLASATSKHQRGIKNAFYTAKSTAEGQGNEDPDAVRDVGGQKTLRSYWRNYFEKTDALIWVVDATDRIRIDDCREELAGLLQEERLTGASLLVFLNKTDVEGGMTKGDIREVSDYDDGEYGETNLWKIPEEV